MATSSIGLYAKAIVGAAMAAATTAISALADGSITGGEWATILVSFLVAVGAIWYVPNTPESVRKYGKAITSALVAGAGSAVIAFTDGGGVSTTEWITILIALAAGAGIVIPTSNAVSSDPVDSRGRLVPQYRSPVLANDVVDGGV